MPLLLYLFTIFIWGTSWYAITFQVQEAEPVLSLFYRFGLAAICMLLLCIVKRVPLRFDLQRHGWFILLGILLFSVNYIFFYFAAFYIISGLIAVIFSLMLVFNTFLNWLIFKQKPDRLIIIGAFFGLLGIVMIFYEDITSVNVDHLLILGIILSMLGAFSASLGNITSRHIQNLKISVLSANFWGMFYASILLGVCTLMMGLQWHFPTTATFTISLFYLSIFATILAFWSYLTLLGIVGPARAAYATVMFPVVALFISTWFEDLQWTWLKLAGVTLTIIGNIIILPNTTILIKRFLTQVRTKQVNPSS